METTRMMKPTEVHKLIKSGYWFHFRDNVCTFPMLEIYRGEAIINNTHIKFYDGFSIELGGKIQPLTVKV